MIDDWIATIPPKPSHTELRRIIATDPVKITLAYQAAPTPRATVIASMGSDVFVVTHYQSDDDDVFSALSCTLERFAAAFRHAAQELIEGTPPC